MTSLARQYDRLLDALGILAAGLVAFVAFATTADIVMRNVGLGTIPAILEYSEYALFLATFLGAPWVLREDAHVRVDVLVQNSPAPVARWLEVAGNLVGVLVCVVLLYFAVSEAAGAWVAGHRIIKMFIVPSWLIIGVVAVAVMLLLVEFARRLRRACGDAPPDPRAARAR